MKTMLIACLLAATGLLAQDSLVVMPDKPTSEDSLFFDLFRSDHCCCTGYYFNAVWAEDTVLTLSYSVDNAPCALCDCVAMGKWNHFATGPTAPGTYAVYRLESNYCPPGELCIDLMPLPVRIGQVTVTRSVTAESGALQPAAGLLDISPNPFNASVCVVFTNPGKKADLSIYTTDGRRVKTFRNVRGEKVSWDAEGLPAGVYVLKAVISGKTLTRKMFFAK